MTFAENLNRICADRGTTPSTILRKLNLSTSKVTMWNNGSLPKQDMLVRLAQELGCSVMDFFADDDYIRPPVKENPLSEDEEEIVRIFRSLDRRSKHEFMNIAYEYEKRTIHKGDKASV